MMMPSLPFPPPKWATRQLTICKNTNTIRISGRSSREPVGGRTPTLASSSHSHPVKTFQILQFAIKWNLRYQQLLSHANFYIQISVTQIKAALLIFAMTYAYGFYLLTWQPLHLHASQIPHQLLPLLFHLLQCQCELLQESMVKKTTNEQQ